MVLQMQLSKRVDAVPLTRDYMIDWERAASAAAATPAGRAALISPLLTPATS